MIHLRDRKHFFLSTFCLYLCEACLKGSAVKRISSDLTCKNGNARFTTVPFKLQSDKKIVEYFSLLLMNKKCANHFLRETANKNSLNKQLDIDI